MEKLSDIFDVEYPKTMILNKQTLDDKGTNFVSSKGTNNGIAARIKQTKQNKLYNKGAITVAMKGSVLSAFLQPEDFYIAHQIAVLYPKQKMTIAEKLFYCTAIEANKYRFNYGRQADRTLRDLQLPSKKDLPNWIETEYNSVVQGFKAFFDSL